MVMAEEAETSDLEYSDYSDLVTDEEDSDAELQRAFERGDIKPGLNVIEERPVKKEKINDVSGLQQKLKELQQKFPWIDRLDLTSSAAPLAPELDVEIQEHGKIREKRMKGQMKNYTLEEDPVHNDFKREMMFYRQAQQAVLVGFERLTKMKLPTVRPDDYFAEMAKSDEHMQKVRQSLMKKKVGQELSERVKKIREIKKFGKKVQIEKEQQKNKEKREMLEKVKKFRKGKTDSIDFLSDQPLRDQGKGNKKANFRRQTKDKKYGQGGKKRGLKKNNKDFDADMSGKNNRKNKFTGMVNRNKKGAGKRLGKKRRQEGKKK